ncbi:hypothetical protein J6W91_01745 [Candidatus Saccharibacteria bacterium]|nr:hypothetical protein [Candidatus Saccharibacteria bacterium]
MENNVEISEVVSEKPRWFFEDDYSKKAEFQFLLQDYNEYIEDRAEGARDRVDLMIRDISKMLKKQAGRRIIRSSNYRIKDFDSAIGKLLFKHRNDTEPREFQVGDMKREVRDIVGARVIVLYNNEIGKVVEAINNYPGVNVESLKDYGTETKGLVEEFGPRVTETEPKPSGYRGLHLMVSVETALNGKVEKTPVEIQIRTKMMDVWASLEHESSYKKSPLDSIKFSYLVIGDILKKIEAFTMSLYNAAQKAEEVDVSEFIQGLIDSLNTYKELWDETKNPSE